MTKARTLADFISDGSPLADGTIDVSEVSGAAPLANPTFTGTASGTFSGPLTGELDLAAIAATKSDTAVDVFVYDTSKDSDGGAWRKRTQGTSWYNETLNTSTRGSRKEFPAVAVIVVDNDVLYIYDGDDPNLPMWMKANDVSSGMLLNVSNANAVTAKNGIIALAASSAFWVMHFVDDRGDLRNSARRYDYKGNIEQRNDGLGYIDQETSGALVHPVINDVAMTVLPNAPIDAATGLPVPTIAIASDGGVSVIKDDGSVISTVSATGYKVHNIDLQSNGNLFAVLSNSSNANYAVTWAENYAGISGLSWSTYTNWNSIGGFYYANVYGSNLTYIGGSTGGTINDLSANAIGSFYGLTKTDKNPSDFDAGLVNFIASTYNTGWQVGDIKLATLSDTDDTNVTGAELVTNGTFDTDTSGWDDGSDVGGAFSWNASGYMDVVNTTGTARANQVISLVEGNSYLFSVDIIAAPAGGGAIQIGTDTLFDIDALGTGTHTTTYTAGIGTQTLSVKQFGADNYTVDNISVRLAEPDRSVNGNGLQVHGTVTKTPVATGADLVGYSFGNTGGRSIVTNALIDPAFVAPTGDMSFMFWTTSDAHDSELFTIGATNTGVPTNGIHVWAHANQLKCNWAGSVIYSDVGDLTTAAQFICVLRRGSVLELYIDGTLRNSLTNSTAITETGLTIGNGFYSGGGDDMALFRISATAPSPEQIAKIYRDEKVLFQENAQATLYGTSDAVTALAHDDTTDLLHVGTSAGRSVFQGLRRVENTTDAVGAAISASNGLVVEE